jgi:hypothetical protein
VALGGDRLEREDVFGCDAVLEAPRTAGIRCDVAADRGTLERAGVGRIEEARRTCRLLNVGRPCAGSDRDSEVFAIDGMDPVEPLEAERNPSAARKRAAGKTRQAAGRHDGNAQPMSNCNHTPDAVGVSRPHDDVGRDRLRPALVRRKRFELPRLSRHGLRSRSVLELADEVRRYVVPPHRGASLVSGV